MRTSHTAFNAQLAANQRYQPLGGSPRKQAPRFGNEDPKPQGPDPAGNASETPKNKAPKKPGFVEELKNFAKDIAVGFVVDVLAIPLGIPALVGTAVSGVYLSSKLNYHYDKGRFISRSTGQPLTKAEIAKILHQSRGYKKAIDSKLLSVIQKLPLVGAEWKTNASKKVINTSRVVFNQCFRHAAINEFFRFPKGLFAQLGFGFRHFKMVFGYMLSKTIFGKWRWAVRVLSFLGLSVMGNKTAGGHFKDILDTIRAAQKTGHRTKITRLQKAREALHSKKSAGSAP